MLCPKCSVANPEGKRFCSDCGSSLDVIDEEFRRNVKAIFRQELRDQKLVEVETMDAVLNRIKIWVKPAMWGLGVALLLTGFLGFRSWQDFTATVANAEKEAVAQMRKQADQEAQQLTK